MKRLPTYALFLLLNVPAIIAGWFWLFCLVSLSAWLLARGIGIEGCRQGEWGSFECSADLWYAEPVAGVTGWWIVCLLALSAFTLALVRHPLAMWHLAPVLILWIGTLILIAAPGVRIAKRLGFGR